MSDQPMNVYRGRRTCRGSHVGRAEVLKNGVPLEPTRSQLAYNHSPDGFAWGYLGSGPAQLALAILLEETDLPTALSLHQDFKEDFVARWAGDKWEITSEEIQTWLAAQATPDEGEAD